ncbi:MAG: hypothetical protein GWP08_02610 [Nitrospiraceae bacterium]|nr:hypothetical protein [Nitrospiraceae bacterium]
MLRTGAYVTGLAMVLFCLLASVCQAQIVLNEEGYFEGPGLNFLVYHNTYIGGRQGGLQMLLHGTRVLDAGTLFYRTVDGKGVSYYSDDDKKVGERQLDLDQGVVSLSCEFTGAEMKHDLVVGTDGESITISARLDKPVDWDKISECVLKIEIFPEAYFGKAYMGGGVSDFFRHRHMGRRVLIPSAKEIVVAPESPLQTLTFSANNAVLSLRDERRDLKVSGYMVFASLTPGSTETSFSMTISPTLDSTWRRPPVIQFSQLGYHPAQQKIAVLELDSRETDAHAMELLRVDKTGTFNVVKTMEPVAWGPLFDYNYHNFDFTDVVTPGQYYLRYGDQQEGPFRIDPEVYETAWQPTMDTFFPVQMCHTKVRDYLIVWHGACHVDDAMQAPSNLKGQDGYRQGAETETPFKEKEHIPGLDWGGWHDAGDFDLPSGAVAGTAMWMALAYEEFGVERDVTSVSREARHVELYEPDGQNDMLQQVAFGMEYLLGQYRAFGHIGAGVIATTGPDYGRIGDPASITDGLVYDESLEPFERKEGRSGTFDDRWIYTTRGTGGQYQFSQVAALAARVLNGHNDALATECLQAAEAVWTFEQTHEPVTFPVAYQPQEDDTHSLELAATAELYLSTGNEKYKERLLALIPSIEAMAADRFGHGVGFTLLRVLPEIDNATFQDAIAKKSKAFSDAVEKRSSQSPYGVSMGFGIWGNNWGVLQQTARLYFFAKQFPELFDAEHVYSGLHYNFGRHPATNHSYVSGVGAKSATVAFGFNRNESTYIPGGVVSGASLIRPKFPDYRARPWDWYQTEYVIQGSAAYVFDVLAADELLNPGAR